MEIDEYDILIKKNRMIDIILLSVIYKWVYMNVIQYK